MTNYALSKLEFLSLTSVYLLIIGVDDYCCTSSLTMTKKLSVGLL